ncbi:hypothetical protein [Phenylobacterium sp.]|uniref:hypothetical protein n=1 Tax=Phenylobacterium sp. TaxID=1871053 RepID=UPI002C3E79E0|nr:hypothetical protein [Phenylobacterium sp.]HVI33203.1 hypothetical protein [Phenylobacterium sp.]
MEAFDAFVRQPAVTAVLAIIAVLGLGYEMRSVLALRKVEPKGDQAQITRILVPAAIAGGIGVLAVVALLLTYAS